MVKLFDEQISSESKESLWKLSHLESEKNTYYSIGNFPTILHHTKILHK